MPDRVKSSFVIFGIRALWLSGLTALQQVIGVLMPFDNA